MIGRIFHLSYLLDEKDGQDLQELLKSCYLTIEELYTIIDEKNYGKKIEIKTRLHGTEKSIERRELDLTNAKFSIDPNIKKLTLTLLKLTNFIIRTYIRGSISGLLSKFTSVMNVYVDAMYQFNDTYREILSYIHSICDWLYFMIVTITDTYVKEHNK